MSKAIYQINVQSPEGLKLAAKGTIEIEAYNVIPVTIEASSGGTAGSATVELGTGTGRVNFLSIKDNSDLYDGKISFKVNADTTEFQLGGPLVMIGRGSVEIMSIPVTPATTPPTRTQPSKLVITNQRSARASLEVLVGRDPTL